MLNNTAIKNIMSTELITISPEAEFSSVQKKMKDYCIRHIPVIAKGNLVGMVSKSDILEYSVNKAFKLDDVETDNEYLDPLISLTDIMQTNLITIKEEDTIQHAIDIFLSKEFHSLPVVDRNNCLVGIVTTDDLLTYFSKN